MVVAKVIMTGLTVIGVLVTGFIVLGIIYDAVNDWVEKHKK